MAGKPTSNPPRSLADEILATGNRLEVIAAIESGSLTADDGARILNQLKPPLSVRIREFFGALLDPD